VYAANRLAYQFDDTFGPLPRAIYCRFIAAHKGRGGAKTKTKRKPEEKKCVRGGGERGRTSTETAVAETFVPFPVHVNYYVTIFRTRRRFPTVHGRARDANTGVARHTVKSCGDDEAENNNRNEKRPVRAFLTRRRVVMNRRRRL